MASLPYQSPDATPSAENDAWPGTDAHRYAYCGSCSAVVRDFNGDAVWRDREGYMTCDHESPAPGSTFHTPRVTPPETFLSSLLDEQRKTWDERHRVIPPATTERGDA